jgi:hypothetical protein
MGNAAARPNALTRRQTIVGGTAAAAWLLAPAPRNYAEAASGSGIATGFVFEDRSGTGCRKAGDPGVPGVMVSNGRDVVLTGQDGSWRLPVASGDSLFVIKPPHWATPLGPGGIPKFSYLHQPAGTPRGLQLRYPGVAPTGPLPSTIDFPLQRQPEPRRFEALLLADTQPANATELGYVRDEVIAGVLDSGAAFAIHHGDVMGDDLSLYARYLDHLGASGIPWHHCPGNHDMNLDSPDACFAFETWKRVFGPPHYAVQYAGATFILLNNVEPRREGQGYRGRIGEHQLSFVANVLRHVPHEELVVVSMHIPLVNYDDPANPADTTVDRRALLELLARRPHTVSFAGHSHTTEHHYMGAEDGFARELPHHHHVLTAASGSWWSGPYDHRGIPVAESRDGTPRGLHVLSVDGNGYATRFVPSGRAKSQMRILLDCPEVRASADRLASAPVPHCEVSLAAAGKTQLLVDVFDGGPRTRVVYEIKGQAFPPVVMERTGMCDPFIVELFARNKDSCKPWVAPAPSSHIWTAPLPAGLRPGAYRLVVRTCSEFGDVHVGHAVLDVLA